MICLKKKNQKKLYLFKMEENSITSVVKIYKNNKIK